VEALPRRLEASNSEFDVAKDITKDTFTNKSITDEDDINLEFGFHPEFVDWCEAHLNSLCKDPTENIFQHISSIKAAHQIEEHGKITEPNPHDSSPTAKITIPHVQDASPTEESSFSMDLQQSIPSQTQGSMDTASGIFFGSNDFEEFIDQEIAQKEKQDHEQFNIESVTAIDDIDGVLLARNFFLENNKSSKRNTKGPKRQNLEDYPVENRANIIKCREYRKKKKDEQLQDMNEMKALEIKNIELRRKKQMMKESIFKMKRDLEKLIKEGKIKNEREILFHFLN